LRGRLKQKPVRSLRQRAAELDKNLCSIAFACELVRLINHRAGAFAAGNRVGIRSLDRQRCTALTMGNALQMILDMESFLQCGIKPDGSLGLLEGNRGNLLGRGDKHEFGFGPAIDNQRRQHDRPAGRRFAVPLGN
jgi:hypothetical protein